MDFQSLLKSLAEDFSYSQSLYHAQVTPHPLASTIGGQHMQQLEFQIRIQPATPSQPWTLILEGKDTTKRVFHNLEALNTYLRGLTPPFRPPGLR
jgi:hypothetical protein